jgi:hypothetical protein
MTISQTICSVMIYWNARRVKPAALSTMDISLKDTRLTLARDGLIALRDAHGTRIACLEGSLWITQECSIKDEVLAAGKVLRLRHDGLTIVTALEPSALVLSDDPSSAAGIVSAGAGPAATRRERLARWFAALAPGAAKTIEENRNARWNSERFIRAV